MSSSVSRETPATPEAAREVFATRLPLAVRYAALLATDGVLRGVLGPREVPRLWDRHLLNCAVLGGALENRADVCDIGTGAGLPGVVLAIHRPDLQVTLVEPLLRRTTFLDEVVADLGLVNVEVVRARAEQLHGRREFSVVTSRAVAPLDRLLGWSMPLVRKGGAMLAMKGSSARSEVAAAESVLAQHGAGAVAVETYGEGVVDPPTTVVRVEATRAPRLGSAGPASTRGPRSAGRSRQGKDRLR